MLSESMNTYNISLYAIGQKGYNIKLELDEAKEEIVSWIATKGDITISAFNPLSLLALVIVIEQYGAEWKQIETGNLYDVKYSVMMVGLRNIANMSKLTIG